VRTLRWSPEAAERLLSARALAPVEGPEAAAALAEALVSDPSAEVRVAAAQGLAGTKETWLATPALLRALVDPAAAVSEAALVSLSVFEERPSRTEIPSREGRTSVPRVTGRMRREDMAPESVG
jgi:HEAT repeat protein